MAKRGRHKRTGGRNRAASPSTESSRRVLASVFAVASVEGLVLNAVNPPLQICFDNSSPPVMIPNREIGESGNRDTAPGIGGATWNPLSDQAQLFSGRPSRWLSFLTGCKRASTSFNSGSSIGCSSHSAHLRILSGLALPAMVVAKSSLAHEY